MTDFESEPLQKKDLRAMGIYFLCKERLFATQLSDNVLPFTSRSFCSKLSGHFRRFMDFRLVDANKLLAPCYLIKGSVCFGVHNCFLCHCLIR
jgi:hypothetical protein